MANTLISRFVGRLRTFLLISPRASIGNLSKSSGSDMVQLFLALSGRLSGCSMFDLNR